MTSTSTHEEQASDAAAEAANIPAGWAYTSLGTVAELKGGITKGQKRRWDEPVRTVPYLRVANVQRGHIDLSDVSEIEATDRDIAELQLRTGDVLFNEGGDRDKLGRGWVWEGQLPLCIHQNHVFRARIRNGIILPKLLSLYGNTFGQRYFLQEGKQTTNLASINLTKLSALPVPVPPLAEQRRMLAKVEALTAKSRCAKEALDAVPPLLDRFRKAVLAAAFRGDLTADWREKNPDVEPAEELLKRIRAERRRRWEEAELAKMRAKGKVPGDDRWKARYEEPEPVDASELPELPEGWAWGALGELAWDAGYGTSEKCDYGGAGAPVLRIPNVARGRLDLLDLKRTVQRAHLDPGEALQPGDFLVVRTNGSKDLIGRAALAHDHFSEPHYFASYLIRFRLPRIEQLPRWIEAVWSAPQIRLAIERMAATSAGQYNISLGNLNGLPIPIPPASEQIEITHKIMSTLAFVERLEALLADAQEQKRTLDRAILAKAFRGELVPQDPSDEPASVLLERLRVESAENGTTSNGANRRRKAATPELREPVTQATKLAPSPRNRAPRSARR
ncbi:restriction endonuclease subunit S [Sorangium sp. So ce185]|uniref:restriction endonuclease subunit S n=1 Tax=Sorangium sp. So ce185 TaxID=3133287 RepID=UPI003F601681